MQQSYLPALLPAITAAASTVQEEAVKTEEDEEEEEEVTQASDGDASEDAETEEPGENHTFISVLHGTEPFSSSVH